MTSKPVTLCRLSHVLLAALVIVGLWSAGPVQARSVQELTTPSGLGVWLVEERGVPLVAMGFAFRGGSAQDPEGKEGLGNIVAQMFDEGAGTLDAQAFKRELANAGANLTFTVSPRAFSGGLVALKKHLPKVTGLLKIALHSPRFEKADFERVLEEEIASLAFEERDPEKIALRKFYQNAFPSHPYGRPSDGTTESIKSITYEQVVAHREKLIDIGALHVVLVGDIGPNEAVQLVDDIFIGLPRRNRQVAVEAVAPAPLDLTLRGSPGQAIEVGIFALPMPRLGSPDFFAAMALNSILGSGNLDALLTREVRVKRGLTYAISSHLVSDPTASFSLGMLTTRPGKMEEALTVIREVYADTAENGPSEKQLANTKTSLSGSYLLRIDTSSKLTNQLLGLWIDGLPPDYASRRKQGLEALDRKTVARVARRYFAPEKLSTIILTPPGQVSPAKPANLR